MLHNYYSNKTAPANDAVRKLYFCDKIWFIGRPTIKISDRIATENLIDPKKVIEQAQKEMDIIQEAGPKETDIDEVRDDKRVFLVAEQLQSYETTPDDFANLNQNISLNLKGVDFRDAMNPLLGNFRECSLVLLIGPRRT